jgi:Asp-tRNA(Asn)/Glu-tRNA(Gln) amidotransferase A subunit family amidase
VADVALPLSTPTEPPPFRLCPSPAWAAAEPEMVRAWEALSGDLARWTRVEPLALPDLYAEAIAAQERIMAYQAFRALSHEWRAHRDMLSPMLRDLLADGRAMSRQTHDADLAIMQRVRAGFADVLPEGAVLLTPSAPGAAPAWDSGTGSPVFNRLWTLIGAPCVTVPGVCTDAGLPLGVQVVARPGQDRAALEAAAWLEARLRQDRAGA